VYEAAHRSDGFVSVEVAPELADDTAATIAAARRLHERVGQANALVKIPATAAGVPAVEAMAAEGRSINVTLIFSLPRYAQIIEAYMSGLEAFAEAGGDLWKVHGVASFFVSRVDTEVDRRLGGRRGLRALELRGRAAISQAKLAYRLFNERFSGERWHRLASQGANHQRPLRASMAVKIPAARDTRYFEHLSGPYTVCTLPEATIAAFEDHGMLIPTIDTGVSEAMEVMRGLAEIGIDIDDVALTLESEGIEGFHRSFQRVSEALDAKKHRAVA
jgi:transaldolase